MNTGAGSEQMDMKNLLNGLACGALLLLGSLCSISGAAQAGSAAQQEFRAAMQRTPDINRGRELFATCAACHNVDGSGIEDGSVPAIAGQYYAVIVKQLTDFRDDSRWNLRMERCSTSVI
jgi:cytochrome c553